MGLAPSANGENPGKTALAKVPVPIFSQPHRVVSPIRFLDRNRFLALCLSREEPRPFYPDRCQNVRLAPATDFLMPVSLRARWAGVKLAIIAV